MKSLLALFAVAMVTGCDTGQGEALNTVAKSSYNLNGYTIEEYSIHGHKYLVGNVCGQGIAIIHAAHCPCQDTTKGE